MILSINQIPRKIYFYNTSLGSLENDTEKIMNTLSDGQKDILRAGLIAGWSTQFFSSKDSIIDQVLDPTRRELDKLLQELMNYKPPLIERGPVGQNFRFSKIGAYVAKAILKNIVPYLTSKKPLLTIVNSYSGRGGNNKAMKDYADLLGWSFVKQDPARCSKCHHKNTVFIKSGSTLLCQECFKRGVRL